MVCLARFFMYTCIPRQKSLVRPTRAGKPFAPFPFPVRLFGERRVVEKESHMKKLLSLVMAMMLVFALAACGGAASSAPPPAESTAPAASVAEPASTGGTDTPAEPAGAGISKEEIKIGVLHILDPSDQGYTYNHDLGTQYMCEQLGIDYDTQIVNKFNINDQDVAATNAALNEMVEAGCHIIFATSFSYGTQVAELAKQVPDVQFCHATGTDAHTAGVDNLHNYFAKIHQARYLAGIAAGLKAAEIGNNKMGYVGAFPFAEVISGFTSFYLGAKSVNPDVTMEVIYINSWGDAIKEREVAETLIGQGCGVLSQHSDGVAPALAAEEAGVFHVGYNNDMTVPAPNASLLSARINWGMYMTEAVQHMLDGSAIPVDWSHGINGYSDGAAFLSPLNEAIAAPGTMDAINAAIAELEGGKMVFSGHLLAPDGSDAVITSFSGDVLYTFTGDDSSFEESPDTASAPAFNAIIQGINAPVE